MVTRRRHQASELISSDLSEAKHPWSVSLGGFGECLARHENQVSINKDVVDAWGIPALHIDMSFGDNERDLVNDMGEQAAVMLEEQVPKKSASARDHFRFLES